MLAQLLPIDGSRPLEIARDVTVVGRSEKLSDITLDHASVSKIHCLLARTDGLMFFRDLGSTNGTRVNGQKVTRGALLPGDELCFGRVKFRVHLGPGDTNHDDSEMIEQPQFATEPDADLLDDDDLLEDEDFFDDDDDAEDLEIID